ncbi:MULTISPECIES: hypothetical protein [unclassified Shewanella]|uniref:hypothetical protein n=1 Tax=unclassified Shewanella TaxID=196818 RepID=UPI0021D82B2E|nr:MULTISPECIES: hypothetical protein [unclassified Shewanella]MCU8024033.1 hypothetical protein [Shewanella sp. SM78]MCU8080907.1 hypothetical protein [Shewanella sp. SM103]
MILQKTLILLMAPILIACSPNYNEKLITEADMISNVETLMAKIKKYNIKEISYYSEEVIILNGIVINPLKKLLEKVLTVVL